MDLKEQIEKRDKNAQKENHRLKMDLCIKYRNIIMFLKDIRDKPACGAFYMSKLKIEIEQTLENYKGREHLQNYKRVTKSMQGKAFFHPAELDAYLVQMEDPLRVLENGIDMPPLDTEQSE
jgi:hypothetical protein